MHKLSDWLLKIVVRIIFIKDGFCEGFSGVHIKKHNKKPSRYIKHFVVKCFDTKYIIAMGINRLQKKKLHNTVAHEQEIIAVYKDFFNFNPVVKQGHFLFIKYAIYNYYDNVAQFASNKDLEYALNTAKQVYDKAQYYEISEDNVDDFIIQNIQIILPDIKTQKLVKSQLFRDLRTELLKTRRIKCCAQHGDYNLPNMLKIQNNYYLVDLERVMLNMIASYDWYHLLKCKNGWFNPCITPEMAKVPYANIIKIVTEIDMVMENRTN